MLFQISLFLETREHHNIASFDFNCKTRCKHYAMNVCSLLPCALWTNTFKIRICRMFGVAFLSTCAALVRLHSKSRKIYNRNGFCHSPKTPNKYENVQSRPVTCTPVSHSFGEAFRLRWSDGVNESSATHEMRPDFSVINHKVIRRTKKTYMNDNDHPSLLAPSILPKFKFFFRTAGRAIGANFSFSFGWNELW